MSYRRVLCEQEYLLSIPMIWQGDRTFVEDIDDPIINQFIDQLPDGDFVFDSRSHVLQPGMTPCIGGWHLDFIARKSNGDLDWEFTGNRDLTHYILFIGNAPTRVLNQKPMAKFKDWSAASAHIDEGLELGFFSDYQCQSGVIEKLNWNTYHKGVEARKFGLRCFMRATYGWHGQPQNQIRRQTQVYLRGI